MDRDDATPRRLMDAPGTRPTTGRLVAHALGLWMLLVVLAPIIGVEDAPVVSDEGAMIMQLEVLADHRSWTTTYPAAILDPEGEYLGIAYSALDDGGLIVYRSRPLYTFANLLPWRLGGIWGVTALGTFACAVTAFLVGVAARHIEPRAALVALWLGGIGSPLLFHAFVLQGHTIGSALAAGAVAVAVRRSPSWREGAIIAVVMLLAVMVRREAAFVAAGLAAWSAAPLLGRHPIRDLPLAVGAVSGAATGLVIEHLVTSSLFGTGQYSAAPSSETHGLSFIEGRVLSIYHSTVSPSFSSVSAAHLGLVVGTMCLLVGARLLRRRRERVLLVAGAGLLLASSVSLIVAHGTTAPLVPGIVTASPVLVAGMLTVDRRQLGERGLGLCITVVVVGTMGILATQYLQAGWEWGARYLAVTVPAAAIVASVGWVRTLRFLTRPVHHQTAGLLIAAALATATLAMVAQAVGRSQVDQLTQTVARVAAAEAADAVVTYVAGIGRLDTSQLRASSADRPPWLWAERDDMPALFEQLADGGVNRVILIGMRDTVIHIGDDRWSISDPRRLPPWRFDLLIWTVSR